MEKYVKVPKKINYNKKGVQSTLSLVKIRNNSLIELVQFYGW